LGYTYDGVKWAVSGQQAEPTQEQLDAFILRAGFRWGWENVESAARMMARQAVTELNALAGQQSERPILAHEAALSGEYHKGYLQGQREARIALAAATPPTPEAEPQALLGWTRYEKARKLNPAQWAELHQRNLKGERFDEMIDALPATTQPVQQDTLRLKTAQVDVRTILEAQGIYLSTPTIDAIVRAATPPAEKQAAPSGEDNHG
jgi:hypothetical protein